LINSGDKYLDTYRAGGKVIDRIKEQCEDNDSARQLKAAEEAKLEKLNELETKRLSATIITQ
jgi:hypothetical protein